MSNSVALTINVHEANAASSLPASLERRLNATPTKSPTELDEEIKAHDKRSAALRQAHLDSVRDRAARTSQLAREAAARKLRNAAARVEAIKAKMDAASIKTEAKKEAEEASRLQAKEHREALALAVAEARKAKGDARTIRHMCTLQREKHASAKHAIVVASVKDKGAASVKHAIAVAQAHKEKEALAAASRGAALESKLAAAEGRREARSSHEGSPATEGKGVLHRVRNEEKVNAEMRRKLFASREAKATEQRAAHLAAVVGKAGVENAKVAAAVTKSQLVAKGADPATIEARHALYEKMVKAEVARLTALKAKYTHAAKGAKGDEAKGAKQERLLVVCLDDIITPRDPPASLVRRLAAPRASLLATAATRQAAAASRRTMAKQTALLKLATAAERRADARGRIAKTLASRAATVAAKATAATVNKAIVDGKAAHAVSLASNRRVAAAAKRQALQAVTRAAGEAAVAKAVSAAARRAVALSARGKKIGAPSARRDAHLVRRKALDAALAARGAALKARCIKASAERAAVLARRVETARKRMAAPHPKREVADMEMKA